MIWFFERRGQYLRCETRQTGDGSYELVVTEPDGTERIERFTHSSAMTKRQLELDHGLTVEGWSGPHGRVM